jgi:hypothetical protein
MSEEKDKNLIDFIAATVEAMRDQMAGMATKDDVSRLEARVSEVESSVHRIDSNLASVKDKLASVKDTMATKNDIARVELKLDAKTTAIRGDIERVQLRLDSMDHAASGRMSLMEGQISRLRSVVYLLVKDQPDILTLLGQPPPGESRPQG